MKFSDRSKLIPVFLLSAIWVVLFLVYRFMKEFDNCNELQTLLSSFGWWGPLVYIFFSSLLMMAFVPRTLMLVIAGICFGEITGILCVMIASLIASTLSFGLARTYARAWVERVFRKRNWFFQLERITGESGFHFVLVARIAHVLHFGATSYACGLLNLTWGAFIWGTFLGILPGTLIAVFSAKVIGCRLWDGSGQWTSRDIYLTGFTSFLILLTAFFPIWLKRKKKS